MRKGLLILLGVLIAATSASASNTVRIPIADTANGIEVLQARDEALSFRVEVGELEAMEVATPEGVFTRLTIPGFHHSRVEGSPELPQMNRLYETRPATATTAWPTSW